MDGGDCGPFQSALYACGALYLAEEKVRFAVNPSATRLYQFDGRKIEGLELVAGKEGGLVFATDDENNGAAVFFSW